MGREKRREERKGGGHGRENDESRHLSVYMCVRHIHSWIAARAAVAGGRVRCHDLLYIQCGCVMQFGAKRCAQWVRRGCTGHDGWAKPAWATRTGLARPPQASNMWQTWLEWHSHGLPTSVIKNYPWTRSYDSNGLNRKRPYSICVGGLPF